jgi:beta-phosphoglucomutase family hydrolase
MTALPNLLDGRYRACLFDMDGVLTDTASVHAAAWKRTFDEFLSETGTGGTFDIATDYPQYVDGKPRDAGVRDFLASRGVHLPNGTPDDAPGSDTIWAVGNRKNELLLSVLKSDGVKVYEDTRRLLLGLQQAGVKLGVVSSSANTKAVLEQAGMLDLFSVRVDGVSIIERHLNGKPAPDTFLEAARELGIKAGEAVVFEDALAGVQAGHNGRFGLVVGVNRVDDAHGAALLANGADVVTTDLFKFLQS